MKQMSKINRNCFFLIFNFNFNIIASDDNYKKITIIKTKLKLINNFLIHPQNSCNNFLGKLGNK